LAAVFGGGRACICGQRLYGALFPASPVREFAVEPAGREFSRKPEGPFAMGARVSDRHRRRNKRMPLYEHVFLARQDLSQSQVDALANTATEIVEANEGKVVKTETWGLKNLAYKIQRNRKAHYVMLNIDAPANVVEELERQTRINEDVIRYMTIKVEEHEGGPSVMMRKNDRERRGRKGDR
jgi:small subunit ribosomal protein S6